MSQLDLDIREADALGISYGKYKAMTYDPAAPMAAPARKRSNRKPRKFTDMQAFSLWQSYLTDEEIGSKLGVSRAYMQRWRDQLELPSTSKFRVNTQKYRLTTMQDGTYIVIISET